MPSRANQNQPRRAAVPSRSRTPSRYELIPLEQRLLLSATAQMIAHPAVALGDVAAPSVGGEVFYDDDYGATTGYGIVNNGHGIPNVEVDLYQDVAANGTTPATTQLVNSAITDAKGDYAFGNLNTSDTYSLTFVAPPDYLIGPEGTSPIAAINSVAVGDNNVTPAIGTYTVPALSATSTITANCGMFTQPGVPPLPTITGTVFNDLNDDGIQDDGNSSTNNGVVTVGPQPVLSGVTVELLNSTTQAVLATTTTNSAGVYSFSGDLTVGSSYLVKFVPPTGYQFSEPFQTRTPTTYSWADPGTGIVDDPNDVTSYNFNADQLVPASYGTQTFTIYSDTAQTDVDCGMWTEVITITGPTAAIPRPHTNASTAGFTVTITPQNDLTVDVPYSTANGPANPANNIAAAIAGTDYTAESGTLDFTPGVSQLSIDVPILPSNTPELNVRFTTSIAPAAGDFVDTADNRLSATATIQNTNFPSVTIDNVTAPRPTAGNADFNFTVTLSSTAPFPVSITYQTIDSSAVAGVDYAGLPSSVLAIPANTLTGTITVQVYPGTTPIQPKSFLVIVQDTTNLTYETTAASATAEGAGIIESNTAPQLSVTGGQVTESLIGNFLLPFNVTVDPAPTTTVTVDYATSDGTGVAGLDYAATSGTLTFAPGQSTQTVNVLAYRRFLSAQDKTVDLTVTDPTGTYNITTATGVGTIHDLATVALPISAKQHVTYTDYLKNPVTIAMKGPGAGTLVFLGNTSVATNAYEVILDGTTSATTLAISTRHNIQTSLTNILSDSSAPAPASMGAIVAPSTNLLGLLTITGSLNTLNLDYVQGATITVGPGTGSLAVIFNRAVDTSITSAIPIKSLTAVSYVATNGTPATITAPSVGPIRVKQGFGGTVVQSASVASVTVGGSMAGSEILASDSIGTVTAGSITGSTIFAGVNPSSAAAASDSGGLPSATDFANTAATIAAVRVKPGGFSDTRIAGWKIGSLSLGTVDPSDDGVAFGVAAHSIASVLGNSGEPIHLLGVSAASTPLVDDDFSIETV